MVDEIRSAAPIVDALCAHPLDAESILKLRYAARNNTVERGALANRIEYDSRPATVRSFIANKAHSYRNDGINTRA